MERGQDKLEGRVEDEIEGREERKKISTWWMDQQKAGQREGRRSKGGDGQGGGQQIGQVRGYEGHDE